VHGRNLAQVHKRLGRFFQLVAHRTTSLAIIGRAVVATTQKNVIVEASASKIDDMQGNMTETLGDVLDDGDRVVDR
jgi:hypothetical protein